MELLYSAFAERFGTPENAEKIFSPYRVCPMGAHIDHQYGKVTGFAIDKGIEFLYEPCEDGEVTLCSLNLPGEIVYNVKEVPVVKQNDWGDYLRGATLALKRKYKIKVGLRGFFRGMLPIGGLSSSAALTLAYLKALCRVNELNLDKLELVMNALHAENRYVGVNCGKLDQSCIVYSKKDHLLFLDNRDDSYELIPRAENCKPFEILIFFSGIERTLVGSAFNTRVDELKSAAYNLKAYAKMPYTTIADSRLRDVPREVFEQYKDRLPENQLKRATHYYSEMERVEKATEAWRRGDIDTYGRLSFESGESSIYNYETGSDELKALWEIMRETDGIYGGRFSGAGFKGCCMALADPSKRDSIAEKVEREYLKRFPHLEGKFSWYACNTCDGISLPSQS